MPFHLEKIPTLPSETPENAERRMTGKMAGKRGEGFGEIVTEPKSAEKKRGFEDNKNEYTKAELELVKERSQEMGYVFDQDHTVDARWFWSLERIIQYHKDRDGTLSPEILQVLESGQAEMMLLNKKTEQLKKIEAFNKTLEGFEGRLQYARINPVDESSPVSPSQAIEYNPDGTFRVVIPQEFIEQVRKIKEQASDTTLLVPFYDHRFGREKASDVPNTKEQIEKYITICQKIIEEVGGDIQLELGKETNVARSTGKMFEDKLQHASHVDSAEYGKFFFEAAKSLKEKSPSTKLSISGVACFDPTYLREVLGTIKRLQVENNTDKKLVDTISFHPYRKTAEGGAVEVRNGKFVNSELNYESQLEEMKRIASEFGVELRVGEINFSPFNLEELKASASLTAKHKVTSFVYPSSNMPESAPGN